jgi:hypothetical protein
MSQDNVFVFTGRLSGRRFQNGGFLVRSSVTPAPFSAARPHRIPVPVVPSPPVVPPTVSAVVAPVPTPVAPGPVR